MKQRKMSNLIRARMILPGYTASMMKNYILNQENLLRNNAGVKEFKVLERKQNYFAFHYKVGNILDRSERDSECRVITIEFDGLLFIITLSKNILFPEVRDNIKMNMLKVSKCWNQDGALHFLEFSNIDMQGKVPARLFNRVMSN